MAVAFHRSLLIVAYSIKESSLQKIMIVAVTTLALLLSFSTPVKSAEIAPDWSLVSAEGQTVRLSDEVKQQTIVLFFWATWCPYCKALMPHLQSMRLEYGEDIKRRAINLREDGDPVEFIENRTAEKSG